MSETEALAETLKKLRKAMHKTQSEFAFDCGVSQEVISLMERQKTDPKLSTLQNIAAYVNQSVSELLKVEGEEQP